MRGRGNTDAAPVITVSLQEFNESAYGAKEGEKRRGYENGGNDEGEGGRVWAGNGVGTQ